jgi:hypothetical protein
LTESYNVLLNYVTQKRTDRTSAPTFLQTDGGSGGRVRGGGGRGRGNRGSRTSGSNHTDDTSPPSTTLGDTNPTSNNTSTSSNVSSANVSVYPSSTSFSLHQANDSPIPKHWIILDSASSIDLFVDQDLLTDIRNVDTPMQIISNAGSVNVLQQGNLDGYPETIWYYPNGAANVLSLRNITKHFRVTFDSKKTTASTCMFDMVSRYHSYYPITSCITTTCNKGWG